MPDPDPPKPGPDDDELLDTGQEEVFSRAEVELGVTEHAIEAGRHRPPPPSKDD